MDLIIARLDAAHGKTNPHGREERKAQNSKPTVKARIDSQQSKRGKDFGKSVVKGSEQPRVQRDIEQSVKQGAKMQNSSRKQTEKKRKKKKLSGDARRRKKRKAMLTASEKPQSSDAVAAPSPATTPKKKKRHRTNARCQCSRCGRTLKKKNLRGHLEKCDGTRPIHNPNHVKSEHKDGSTDGALEVLFKTHCEKNGLAGSPEDFATWSESLLKNPEGTMKTVRTIAATNSKSQRQDKNPGTNSAGKESQMRTGATLALDFAGKKKSFSSDDESSEDDDG